MLLKIFNKKNYLHTYLLVVEVNEVNTLNNELTTHLIQVIKEKFTLEQ